LKVDNKSDKFSFIKIVEELQGKFDKVLEYVQNLKSENESLKVRITELEREVEMLKRENEELKKNGIVLFSGEEREELKRKISNLLEKINQYL
jgi:predicted RNase H-like nuclease (RuvC/YqgF family)